MFPNNIKRTETREVTKRTGYTRNMLKKSNAYFLLLLLFNCPAVFASSGKPKEMEPQAAVPAKIIAHHYSSTCGNIIESQWLSSHEAYEASFKAMFQRVISDSKPEPVSINFDVSAMVLISMGQQRTGGYSVKLASELMDIKNNRATIAVQWREAKSGMVTIQMLTNPCLFVEVPRGGSYGNYTIIDVVDQAGKTRVTINTTEATN